MKSWKGVELESAELEGVKSWKGVELEGMEQKKVDGHFWRM